MNINKLCRKCGHIGKPKKRYVASHPDPSDPHVDHRRQVEEHIELNCAECGYTMETREPEDKRHE